LMKEVFLGNPFHFLGWKLVERGPATGRKIKKEMSKGEGTLGLRKGFGGLDLLKVSDGGKTKVICRGG